MLKRLRLSPASSPGQIAPADSAPETKPARKLLARFVDGFGMLAVERHVAKAASQYPAPNRTLFEKALERRKAPGAQGNTEDLVAKLVAMRGTAHALATNGLDFGGEDGLSIGQIAAILELTPNLMSLSIGYRKFSDADFAMLVNEALPKLKLLRTLNMQFSHVTAAQIGVLAGQREVAARLEALHVGFSSELGDEGVHTLAVRENFPRLVKLDISDCLAKGDAHRDQEGALTGRGMRALLAREPRIPMLFCDDTETQDRHRVQNDGR